MALVEINWKPQDKIVRDFGNIAPIATLVIALVLYFAKGVSARTCGIIFAVGVGIFICRLISLKAVRVVFIGFSVITAPIGMVVSFIVLAMFYYLILTPIGLFFKIIGRDGLCRKFEPEAKSYWFEHKKTDDMKRYFNQF